MIKNFLSRYNPRYPRSLVYMLQASEYNIRDYLAWYHRTIDFVHVEKRKQFVKTKKALLLLRICWIIIFSLIGSGVWALLGVAAPLNYVFFVLIILVSPYMLAYIIVIPLSLIETFIQKPI
ncbi:MAG: hypothetical protein U1A23_00095, partial [Candidatus Sungbacteria bacterium]|nr:hypothetical protein [Candidatus Sungbacteria bacterium]